MTIQSEAEEKKILERIVAVSEEFLQSAEGELNYQKISDNILDISGAKYAVFDLYDEAGSKFRTVAFSAPEGVIKKASSLLGFKLLGKKWEHDPVSAEKIKWHTITHFSTLSELAGNRIAKPMVSLIEKTFNTGEVVYVKILKENVMIGDFTLIMPASIKFKNDNCVEIYTRQVGLLITRNKATEALRESEGKYRSLIERANDGIAVLVDGIIRFSNHSLAAMLGYEIREIDGFEFARFIPPENLELVLERYRKRMAGEKLSPVFETVLLHKSGNKISVEINGAVIRYEGKPADMVIMRDITERKKAEEQISFQSNLLADVSEAIIATDINYNISFWNKIAEKQYGWTAAEVIGYPMEKFINNDYLGGSLEIILRKISQDGYWQGEVIQNHRDGVRIPTLSTVSVIKDNKNQPVGFVAINRDISERKNIEESLQESEEIF